MHRIDDKPNGITVTHDGDWSGQVCIAWWNVADIERREPPRRCWCWGPDLIAGLFTPTSGPPSDLLTSEPPINIVTRAVALAVESCLRDKMAYALDSLFIKRGKL
jgi:hypothetical protein